jgi:hypothetical protein
MVDEVTSDAVDSERTAGALTDDPGVDEYRALTLLARGGTATVYSATRRSDGAPVVVKVFDHAADTAFDRQLRAAERLDGVEGVLPVSDHGNLRDGRGYLVSPFLAGGSLADHLARFGPMSPERVAAIGGPMARALAAAHAAGVLHRDLKPSNVLLDGAEHPVIADFGAAGSVDPDGSTTTASLTTMYAAPEVLEGSRGDERSDVYSLGLTLYALALGAHPFTDSDSTGVANLVNRICSDGVPDPAGHDLPAGLASVLRTATAIDPERRYGSSDALADALDAVCSAPDAVPPGSSGRRSRSPRDASRARRRRTVAALVAVVVVAAAVWIGVAAKRSSDREAERAAAIAALGTPVTPRNGRLGPLYRQGDIDYVGLVKPGCRDGERMAELSIHAGPADTSRTPWDAIGVEGYGVFMSYMPCDTQIDEARYKLGATGRWYVVLASFPEGQYERMVRDMHANETSPSPDYTVDEDVLETLKHRDAYDGWAVIDRPA